MMRGREGGMTDRKFNYVAGEWLVGESEIENRLT
jgi:hypothetical protein